MSVRELTPLLVRGPGGATEVLAEGELAPGLTGTLCHHSFSGGEKARRSTVVLTAVPEGVAFARALACRDRDELKRVPAQLPAERWQPVVLESSAFERRYRLLALAGQDPVYVRELFTPALIDWLTHEVPAGFSFELNDGHLAVALPDHLARGEEADRLCELAAEVARRIRAEAEEEGEDGNLFDEAELRTAIEVGLAEVGPGSAPESVAAGIAACRAAARRSPRVLLSGLLWGLAALVVFGGLGALLAGPVAAVFLGLPAGLAAFAVGRTIAAWRHRWGPVSTSRLGLEAFVRGYAESRSLRPGDRWRFHARHRGLPLPGTASHVLDGPLPEDGIEATFALLADDAEMRSRGSEIAYTAERPLAALAVVAELAPEAVGRLRPPEGFRLETAGTTVALWRPYRGNLLFTAAELDKFRNDAGAAIVTAAA